MTFHANFEGVTEGGKTKPIEEGLYTLTITETKEMKSSAGNDMVQIIYTVSLGAYQGHKIYEYIVFNKDIMGRTMHFLHVIGEPYQGNITITPENWIGSRLVAEIEIKEYNGDLQNNVKTHELCEDSTIVFKKDKEEEKETFKDGEIPF